MMLSASKIIFEIQMIETCHPFRRRKAIKIDLIKQHLLFPKMMAKPSNVYRIQFQKEYPGAEGIAQIIHIKSDLKLQ